MTNVEQRARSTRPRARHRTTPRLAVAPTVELVPLAKLTRLEENPRQHGPRDLGYLEDVLQRVGAARSGVIDEDGIVLAGNGFREAAMHAGFTQALIVDADGQTPVFVRRRGLSKAQKDELIVANNQATQLSTWDRDLLKAYAERNADIRKGWTDQEWAAVLAGDEPVEPKAGLTDPDAVPVPRATDIQAGDLFELGRHRLVCGDCTKAEVVSRHMGSARAACMWTDPPYGIQYVGKTREALTIANDSPDGLASLLASAFQACDGTLAAGAALYIAHPDGPLSRTFMTAVMAQGWRYHQRLIWVKDTMVLGHCDYHYRHEPILLAYKGHHNGRGKPGWYGPQNATSVLEIARPKASPDHPTGKPVELVGRLIANSCPAAGRVLDPFGGSGTTLIAAEQLGISCRAVELSPAYCQVIIDRWEAFVGNAAKAVKVGEAVRG